MKKLISNYKKLDIEIFTFNQQLTELKSKMDELKAKKSKIEEKIHNKIMENKKKFTDKKSTNLEGCVIGFRKSKETIEYIDDEKTLLKNMKKYYKNNKTLLNTLIKKTESPIKSNLSELSKTDKEKLNIKTIPGKDNPYIKVKS